MSVRSLLLAVFAAVTLAACGSSSSSTVTGPTTNGPSVTIVSGAQTLTTTAYSPNPMTVSVGTTVKWVNNDSTSHTATANGGAFTTGTIAPGQSGSAQFNTAGSFAYHCSFHPNMVATINVQ